MKKLYSVLFALFLAAGVLTGCGGNTEEPNENANTKDKETQQVKEESAFPVTIKDALDNEVIIDAKPEKIVSLIPSNTEIAFELGLGEQIVGVNDFDNYPAEAAEKEKVGGQEFNVEKVISLSPNLVLAHESTADAVEVGLQQLRDAGIAVVIVNDVENFDQVFETIIMIGMATGKKEEAERLAANMKEKLEAIIAKAADITTEERKKVFVEVSPAPEIFAVGSDTFMNEMLHIIHADNVVTEAGWMQLDSEAVIERNPDVIITTHGFYTEDPIGNVLGRDGWQDITAVKNKQVVDVDSDMVTRTGPRLVEGVEELAKAIYPEIFK
ncbi:iron complex transport system substrate-binding protein [Cytobacillus eiseniae]|uniref:Iron complex transport system substrate-binding protein n=1 Tax=Cytobacillus eiseniae TaxID=762947 RepID=A0ABS4RHN9_9BACI|nr:ABC transporter substrate-binding protein [Cytobacillus eiseniae]MBP2242420.1 iron complex transport system substrate-binding protein [Cytobacillus eiseniae]